MLLALALGFRVRFMSLQHLVFVWTFSGYLVSTHLRDFILLDCLYRPRFDLSFKASRQVLGFEAYLASLSRFLSTKPQLGFKSVSIFVNIDFRFSIIYILYIL